MKTLIASLVLVSFVALPAQAQSEVWFESCPKFQGGVTTQSINSIIASFDQIAQSSLAQASQYNEWSSEYRFKATTYSPTLKMELLAEASKYAKSAREMQNIAISSYKHKHILIKKWSKLGCK